ncbi:helix-turn-helix domain-containing protein [Rufibacter tibetensis]|uniref:helix-turn-helix domain-containing protein n=1 Tax=Rufibacter tibetensis TaxID=512763 RepID=UPI000785D2A6|nr:helix-turn-helix domain-containing protein [Rufibacter tibetensis]
MCDRVSLTERTFERNFLKEVGITPKQFAKIIQFQSSLEGVGDPASGRLTEVAFDNGYADQSHFTRVFKSYTGLSPKQYRIQASLDS